MLIDQFIKLLRTLGDDDLRVVADVVRKLEEDRKIVDVGGESVEAAARNPNPEKR